MKKINTRGWICILLCAALIFSSCRKRDALLPDNHVIFETTSLGLADNEDNATIRLRLSRNTDKEIPLIIRLNNTGVVYGTDYTTTPAADASGEIKMVIPSGNNEASVKVSKVPGALFDGDEKIDFEIYSSGSPVLIGNAKLFTLSFAELIADQLAATINGGGASYPNKVFIDLSANRQTAVLRTTWDLGFYMGADDHRVILNSSAATMARQIDKTDLNAVTAADTVGFSTEVAFSQAAPTPASLPYIDYPDGDLNKTAIAAISATADENKVYIINRGLGIGSPAPHRGWKKIRVLRNASGGYTVQHADITATSFSTVDIAKDDAYFFKYISFENGPVNVEPPRLKWDIAWTYFSFVTNFGSEVPYLFQDIVIQNRNVQVAKVLVSSRSFESFNESSLNDPQMGLSWNNSQTSIGSDWRAGGGPGMAPSVRSDRYYIIRDGENNFYKLRFTALTKDGERGYPAFEAVLVKKGS